MNADKKKQPAAGPAKPAPQAGTPPTPTPGTPVKTVIPPLYRKVDWLAFGITAIAVLIGYLLTLAPEVTMEDSGELATGSFYAGVPHPPGYPLWSVYTWFFTLLPLGNIAYRVAVGVAVSGALAAGLIALVTSRGSSMMIESILDFRGISRRTENAICVVSGFIAGVLLAFNGYMWSQAVIVEVYPFSVLSLMGVIACLLRYAYAPNQRRYAYFAWLLFGLCVTNHQTLLLAAMGIELVILMAQPKLGRDLMLANSIVYIIGYIMLQTRSAGGFELSEIVGYIYHSVGVSSIIACIFLTIMTKKLGTEMVPVLIMFTLFAVGAAFYLFMPLTSMTNPPMNWGYPRTVDGFMHALTRGQYEKANPTNFLKDPNRLFMQLGMYGAGAADEFNIVNLLVAIVPFLFILRMQRRERGWLIGLSGIWFCLAIILLIMLNPSPDRQSKGLNRVFFTASYTVISILIGYGFTLIAASLTTQFQKFRPWGIIGGAAAVVLAFFSMTSVSESFFSDIPGKSGVMWFFASIGKLFQWSEYVALRRSIGEAFQRDQFGVPVYAGMLLLALTVVFLAIILISQARTRVAVILALFALMPVNSVMLHWSDNEQRGHWFGYWFGHDMFTPPFVGPDGKFSYDAALREQAMKGTNASLIYPEMTRNAILFGGTDPGRFCPTYMIFCESFTPHDQQPKQDQKFDRRDVYIITQNALADGTYLEYIRAHYNRSTQKDPPFFMELLRGSNEMRLNYTTNWKAQLAYDLLDRPFLKLGAEVEAARRARGVYPPKEIYTPSPADSSKCFNDYMSDVQQRYSHDQDPRFKNEPRQMRPGEILSPTPDGRVTVQGQVSVMAINGLLTKVIFDQNPTNEFFVEESFPLDWMYPYLTPFGVIMKINRNPMETLPEEVLQRDHEFWSKYSERLIGNWITYDTPIKEIADFVEKVYLRRNFAGFKGDRAFIRDDVAQKSFSKLRTAIAGIYGWRLEHPNPGEDQGRLLKEAEFAYRQAFAFCPYSPDLVFHYVPLLARMGRLDDALAIAESAYKLDPNNGQIENLVRQLSDYKKNANQAQAALQQMEKDVQANPTNFQAAFNLAATYMQAQQGERAILLLDGLLANTNANVQVYRGVADQYYRMQNFPKLETALQKICTGEPQLPENWYNLAAVQTVLGQSSNAIVNLRRAIDESNKRLATQPGASNLVLRLQTDGAFNILHAMPDFQQLTNPAATNR